MPKHFALISLCFSHVAFLVLLKSVAGLEKTAAAFIIFRDGVNLLGEHRRGANRAGKKNGRLMNLEEGRWIRNMLTRRGKLMMVRNIDMPEAIVLYGPSVWLDDGNVLRSGLVSFIDDCQELDTPIIALGCMDDLKRDSTDKGQSILPEFCRCIPASQPPPNPFDLCQALESLQIQPRPFGGSSGFGAQQRADPIRSPLSSRTVVFTSTVDQTRAARLAGTRVIRIDNSSSGANTDDDHLADAVVADFEGIWLEDIATPGSFWLNPPQPRDDEGNRVDPEQVIKWFAHQLQPVERKGVRRWEKTDNPSAESQDIDDDELRRILADLEPL